jgi:hypothetical protein
VPIWVGLGLLLAGSIASASPTWWPAPILAALAAAALIWFHGERLSPVAQRVWLALIPDSLDTGDKGVLDRPTERGYLALLLLGGGSWCSARMQHGLTDPILAALAAQVGALGVPWWWHRGWRRRRPLNTWARRWRRIDGNPDLKVWHGSKVVAITAKGRTTTLTVRLRAGRTIRHVGTDSLVLSSVLGLRPGAVSVAMDSAAARRVLVRVVPRDPWRGVLPHPLPQLGSLSLVETPRVMLGRHEDGDPCEYKLGQHALVVGATGSGKSVWLESLLAWLLAYRDAAVVAADLASGATLGIWESVFAAPLATTVAEADLLLGRVFAVVEHRERLLAARKRAGELIDVLPPSPQMPWLFVLIDEFPDLIKGAKAGGHDVILNLERLAAKARKTGVWLILGAQNPTANDVGSTELRGALTATVGLGLSARQSQTLWGAAGKEGWDSTPLTEGQFLLRDREANHQTPRVAKGLYLPPAQRRDLIGEAARIPAWLDAESQALLVGADRSPALDTEPAQRLPRPRLRLVTSGDASPRGNPRTPTPTVPRVETTAASRGNPRTAELDERVYAEVPDEHQGGIGGTELATQLDVDRQRVKRSFERLARAGRVKPHPRIPGTWCRAEPRLRV